MRTCVATNTHLHLIKPLGFSLSEKYIKRSGVNYTKECHYTIYDNIEEFFSNNQGTYYFLTRYGHQPHTSFDYSNCEENIYFIFEKGIKIKNNGLSILAILGSTVVQPGIMV